ncbi:MAG: hypothetical protein HZC48_10700 [Nitrospirae bacterium]|nr:hypothetical protein [Nitrospirota bacterium]
MMKKSIAFMIALTIVFVFASLTVAVENKETAAPAAAAPAVKPAHRQVTGDVVSVNAAANTVVVKGKKGDVMLMVNDKTKVMIGNEKKALADIKAGDKVVVRYTEADGKNTAKRIDLVLAPAAKKPAAPAEKK